MTHEFYSEVFVLMAGVPQGSTLSPLLYIFFVKDLPTKVTDRIISSFYADDTSYAASDYLHSSSKIFVTDLLQPVLNDLENYCAKWRIGLNQKKTWCVNFHLTRPNKNTPHLWLSGSLIKYKKVFKFLGITFDEKLTFKEHIKNITDRCHRRLDLLKALRGKDWGTNPEVLIYTYKSFIRPLLEYGGILFAHADKSLLSKLQAVETRAIKLAYRLAPWTTNTWCYKQINVEGILSRLKTQARIFLKKNGTDELSCPSQTISNRKSFSSLQSLKLVKPTNCYSKEMK